jgi:hypothetical protein
MCVIFVHFHHIDTERLDLFLKFNDVDLLTKGK